MFLQEQGRVAQSAARLTQEPEAPISIPGLATYFRFSIRWGKYVHEVLLNRFGDLNLSRKSVVRLTDRPDMTLDVNRGCKTITMLKSRIKFKKAKHGPYFEVSKPHQ